MTLHRLILSRNIHKIFSSGGCTPHHQFQLSHRFTQTTRMRAPFTPKKLIGVVEEKLGQNERIRLHSSALMKPVLFTAGFSVASFVAATIWEYENYRTKMIKAMKKPLHSFRDNFQQRKSDLMSKIKATWNSLSPGDRFFVPICALNLLVFGLWRIPRLQTFMFTYFCSNPVAKATCWPMVLSTFSHYSLFHIFANMYVLHSFSNSICMALGREQLLGMYMTAGVVASLTSYVYKTAIGVSGLSLGASGAIMAVLGYICTQYPDTQLSIIFLPMLTFSAGAAIKVIIGVDIAGCILGWKYFDHAAHLGGALFGIFYMAIHQRYLAGIFVDVFLEWGTARTGQRGKSDISAKYL